MKKVLFLAFIVVVAAFPLSALALTMRVSVAASSHFRTLEVEPGDTVDVTVHLGSSGEMVGGYRVYVVRDADRQAVKTAVSDDSGVITFTDLPPGEFTVVISKTKRQIRENTVAIGDIGLAIHERENSP